MSTITFLRPETVLSINVEEEKLEWISEVFATMEDRENRQSGNITDFMM